MNTSRFDLMLKIENLSQKLKEYDLNAIKNNGKKEVQAKVDKLIKKIDEFSHFCREVLDLQRKYYRIINELFIDLNSEETDYIIRDAYSEILQEEYVNLYGELENIDIPEDFRNILDIFLNSINVRELFLKSYSEFGIKSKLDKINDEAVYLENLFWQKLFNKYCYYNKQFKQLIN